jgi:hypothetical protein
MSAKMGIDGKLYFCAAGIGGTPSWTELTNVKNVTLNNTKAEADATTRTNNGWKAVVATLKEASIEFEMVWDPADTGLAAIYGSYMANTVLGIACVDGTMTGQGANPNGFKADCMVSSVSREENLEGVMTLKVTVKPTYSAHAPALIGLAAS